MGRVVSIHLAGLMFGILFPAAVSAQSTASGIAGVVKDTSGAVLPGVAVEAASPALIEKVRTGVTDGQGQYKIIDLRPGAYTVTFTLIGFATVKREGLELPPNFTASVNTELTVGSLTETVTVSGGSPVVDIQNMTQQNRLSEDVLSNIPTGKTLFDLVTLMPSVVSAPTLKDVGGSQGEYDSQASLHGSKQGDQKLTQDGMRFNMTLGTGGSFNFYINPASAQEIVVEGPAGGSAEYSTGGVQMNVVPKDGGNRFNGSFLANYADAKWQSNNLTADLQARGLLSANSINQVHDFNFAIGGPVAKDRLWFYTAHRYWGNNINPINYYQNAAAPGSYLYTPDLSRPVAAIESLSANSLRFTWQASARNKVSLSFERQHHCDCPNNETTNLAPAAVDGVERLPDNLYQVTWSYPATNRLLLEAGATAYQIVYRYLLPDGVSINDISVLEQSTGFRYNGPLNIFRNIPGQNNGRASMSYVTGSHHFKAGLFWEVGQHIQTYTTNSSAVTYTFSNGQPIALTEYASPYTVNQKIRPELGLFAQDQWTIKRLTLNLGLRFDDFHGYVPASQQPAGLLIGARSFAEIDCVPCWKDINPRVGFAFDLFGTGKTAVKASVGRYVAAENTTTANRYDPVNTSVNNVSRTWHDDNHNLIPDCDLRNPLANLECEKMSNTNFGLPNITTVADPETLNGWGKRGYNWRVAAVIEHELRPGLAANAGYFRTWYGNFLVTDNLAVTPANYDPYCITTPLDSRLPGGGGQQICGLYDINPSVFGLVNNLVAFASKYGKQTEVYNGVDFNVNARLAGGGLLTGGVNIGNSNNSVINQTTTTTSSTKNCFVVDSPQQLYQCEVTLPYLTQFKVAGSYPLPWAVQASVSFQSLPGIPIAATYNAPTALIAPSLGRNLAGGTRTVPIQLVTPFSQFEPRINQIDIRLAKKFQVARVRMQGMFDVYNLTNANPILTENTTYGSSWQKPTQILSGRLAKIGVQMNF
jgi:carboxypeptidase family protein